MFENFVFYFIGVGVKRLDIFTKQIVKYGGIVTQSGEDSRLTHVVIDESIAANVAQCRELVERQCRNLCSNIYYVSALWLCASLREKTLKDHLPYQIVFPETNSKTDQDNQHPDGLTSETEISRITENEATPTKRKRADEPKAYLCSQPSPGKRAMFSNNAAIVREFQKLADSYRATNDTWRLFSYEKAISAINRHDKDIQTYQDAVAIPGVGEKLAEKAMELLETGRVRKVAEICENEETRVRALFCNIWGAGPTAAEAWYQSGCRSLTDVAASNHVTAQQRIGLKYFDEFLIRIPRSEVEQFGDLVKRATEGISHAISTTLVGSYRRGKDTSGDIDVMVTNGSSMAASEVLVQILRALKADGVVTDDLTTVEECGGQRKWLGVGRISCDHLHRRLDLFVVPQAEAVAALMHYTGSALFNRSSRLLASQKGMCLTEHGLFKNTVRKGSEIIDEGELVPISSEADIFLELGLEYRTPEERDH